MDADRTETADSAESAETGPAVDEDQEHTLATKETLQHVVDRLVGSTGEGAAAADVEDRLRSAIEAAGLPEQPQRWVQAVAAEAAAGRRTVLDARFGHDAQPE